MSLVSMRQLLDHAAENAYGLPAFNVNNLEQITAIMEAAHEVGSPVIMQASAGARKYAGEPFLRHLIEAAVEAYPHIPVVMHQDHGVSPAVCQRSIQLGFSSVMMDGSQRPSPRISWRGAAAFPAGASEARFAINEEEPSSDRVPPHTANCPLE